MIYDHLTQLCDRSGIILSYEPLDSSLNGAYLSCDDLHVIFLATRLRDDHPLRNAVLAEELGHYFTLVGNNLPQEHWSRLDRINYSREEAKALRWAAAYVAPIGRLRQAEYEGICGLPALAEYFEVTPSFMAYRLSLLEPWHGQEVV